jgi:hypothetical protein
MSIIRQSIQDRGISGTLIKVVDMPKRICSYLYYRYKSDESFSVNGLHYDYQHSFIYNRTWESERAVEIPYIKKILGSYRGKRILEVGNVLSHYMVVRHDIVDKYEKAKGVINQDIIEYKPNKIYDLAISISTIEHINYTKEALDNLRSLADKIIITFPIGYNKTLDDLAGNGYFSELVCLKRMGKGYNWQQVVWSNIEDLQYGIPYPNANGLVIGTI